MKYPLVEVVWLDAKTYIDEFDLAEVREKCKLAVRHTVGFLVDEDDGGICRLAGTYDPPTDTDEARITDVTVIPTGWIKEVRNKRNAPRKRARKEKKDECAQ